MKNCPRCGAENETNNSFCEYCGARLEQETAKTCPNCGAKISADARFCNKCGAELNDNLNRNTYNNSNPYINNINNQQVQNVDEGTMLGGFLLSFFLGLIGLIIALVVGKPKTKTGGVIGFVVIFIIGIIYVIATEL